MLVKPYVAAAPLSTPPEDDPPTQMACFERSADNEQ